MIATEVAEQKPRFDGRLQLPSANSLAFPRFVSERLANRWDPIMRRENAVDDLV
jgi:hypothetical protein